MLGLLVTVLGLELDTPVTELVPEVGESAVGYGAQWWRLPGGVLAARGIHGQLIAVDRSSATVTVVLSSWPAAGDADAEAALFGLLAR